MTTRAGQHLYEYERKRYPLHERFVALLSGRTIALPADAEHFADVSFYQAGMNWDVYALHARAAIIRIGQNVWPDPSFAAFYDAAKSRGIALGGYWFYDGRASPDQQLAVIKKQMSSRSLEMELFVDWERDYGGPYEGLPRVVELMQGIESAGIACHAVGMYTGYYWFVEHSSAITHAAQYAYLRDKPLWLAWYAAASAVRIPQPWTDWTHWQYGTPTLAWGQPTAEIDANYFNGSRAQFEQKYLKVAPPTGGTIMEQWKIIWANGARLRVGPSVGSSAAPIADNVLAFGTIVAVKDYRVVSAGVEEWAQAENGYWFATVYGGQPRAQKIINANVADMPYRIVLGGGNSPYAEQVIEGVIKAR